MSNISKGESRLLNELVRDCITYRLTETEALEYIDRRYGKKISLPSYRLRKSHVKSGYRCTIMAKSLYHAVLRSCSI